MILENLDRAKQNTQAKRNNSYNELIRKFHNEYHHKSTQKSEKNRNKHARKFEIRKKF